MTPRIFLQHNRSPTQTFWKNLPITSSWSPYLCASMNCIEKTSWVCRKPRLPWTKKRNSQIGWKRISVRGQNSARESSDFPECFRIWPERQKRLCRCSASCTGRFRAESAEHPDPEFFEENSKRQTMVENKQFFSCKQWENRKIRGKLVNKNTI